jgi:hypothetical protein
MASGADDCAAAAAANSVVTVLKGSVATPVARYSRRGS